jgi:hypothetical protein
MVAFQMLESPKKDIADDPEPHLTGVHKLVHEAIKDAYSRYGDGKDRNSAGEEHRSLAVKALDFLQILPYAEYYSSYELAKGINEVGCHLGAPGKAAAKILSLPLAFHEAVGLAGNEAVSYGVLALNHGKANLYEGIHGTVVPHFAWNNAPKIYLPGIHQDGQIDFEW